MLTILDPISVPHCAPGKLQFQLLRILRKMPAMNVDPQHRNASPRQIGRLAALSALVLWLAQPPLMLWPLAMFALVPLVKLVTLPDPISSRGYFYVWLSALVYWLVSLQGLRHAHWAMHFCWIALAAYLALYHVWFLVTARAMLAARLPLSLAVAIAWVGQECLRNHLLTGISACMLGHTVADVAALVQIADLFGTYGVSFVIAAANVALFRVIRAIAARTIDSGFTVDVAVGMTLLGLSILYGQLSEPSQPGQRLGTFALVQRSEPVEYLQDLDREVEMFRAYAADTIAAVRRASGPIDAIVWPESMFTAGNPWMMADSDAVVPPRLALQDPSITPEDLQRAVQESRTYFSQRASYLLDAIAAARPGQPVPSLIVGSGVVHYGDSQQVHCGVINIAPDGSVKDWYGKSHLVMFGEYVPILPHIPGLRNLVPPELGLKPGSEPKRFHVGETVVAPNVCIETAVERVTVNQLRTLGQTGAIPDLIVTVTNDGWFDDSSVIAHHQRCAQLLAIGIRRPILSAANNGPTVWIDSRGQVVDQIETATTGVLFAEPRRDTRTSLYLRIGDWPARLCALAGLLALLVARRSYRRTK